jgi:hypothetical protein
LIGPLSEKAGPEVRARPRQRMETHKILIFKVMVCSLN